MPIKGVMRSRKFEGQTIHNGQKKKRQTGIYKNLQKKNSRSSNTASFKTLGWIQVLQRNRGSNILGMKVKTDIRSWLLKFLVMGRWVMGSNTSHFLCKLCVILSQDLVSCCQWLSLQKNCTWYKSMW